MTAAHLTVLTALLASPAAALAPPLFTCENPDGTRMNNLQIPPEKADFAFGYGEDAQSDLQFIYDCGKGGVLAYEIDLDDPNWMRANDALNRALQAYDDGTPFNIKRLARRLRRAGAEAEVRPFSQESCACDPATYRQY